MDDRLSELMYGTAGLVLLAIGSIVLIAGILLKVDRKVPESELAANLQAIYGKNEKIIEPLTVVVRK